MYQKCFLDYDHKFFIEQEYDKEPTSCIKHQVNELNDIHAKYGGFPKTYTLDNTKIHQLWYTSEQIDYKAIGKQLGIEVVTISSIKQPPGQVVPLHRDTFFQINKKFPDDKRLKVRANIYLQDWKMGQFIQYDDTIDVKWKAGDGHLWDSDVLHLSANAGFEDKYTLQVSGFYCN
tara:strand:- start:93 stop:617 length:525 start_codon:yes stop_codon:yes gene_type:complete